MRLTCCYNSIEASNRLKTISLGEILALFLGPKSSQNVLFKFVELFSEIIRTLTKNDCEETFLEILVLQSVN